jgi:hypothetical protein
MHDVCFILRVLLSSTLCSAPRAKSTSVSPSPLTTYQRMAPRVGQKTPWASRWWSPCPKHCAACWSKAMWPSVKPRKARIAEIGGDGVGLVSSSPPVLGASSRRRPRLLGCLGGVMACSVLAFGPGSHLLSPAGLDCLLVSPGCCRGDAECPAVGVPACLLYSRSGWASISHEATGWCAVHDGWCNRWLSRGARQGGLVGIALMSGGPGVLL